MKNQESGIAPGTPIRELLRAGKPWEQTSDRQVRIGVVGGGFGTGFHWHEHPNARVVAVADQRPDRLASLVERYGCTRTYDDLEGVLGDDEVEAVAIFSPAPDHARHCAAAMEAGKDVFCAVPACMTLEEAEMLVEVKERTGRKYMMAETSYYVWETILARFMVQAGSFGELVYTEGEYYHPLAGAERQVLWFHEGKPTWRYGFPPMHYPTHSTAFLVGVTGERITRVACAGWGPKDDWTRDNVYENPFSNEVSVCVTDQGHIFRCNVCWQVRAFGERAQWFGTEAALYMASSAGQPYLVTSEKEGDITERPDYWHMVPPAMRYESGHACSHPFLTHEFITAILEDREPAINLYEALAMTVPGIIAHQSALRGGEQLEVPDFGPK